MSKKKEILDHIKPIKRKAPDRNYFESLSANIVKEYKKADRSQNPRTKIILWSFSLAAACLTGVLIYTAILKEPAPALKNKQVETVHSELLSDINNEEISTYISENIDDFTLEEIEEVAMSDEIKLDLLDNESTLDFYMNDISKEEIEDYINQEFIDLDEFEDELLIF